MRLMSRSERIVNSLLEADVDDPESFIRNYAHGRFYVAGMAANKMYYWRYGIPSWRWSDYTPNWESAKDYSDALAIARNLHGQSVKWPMIEGPAVDAVFLVPEKGGNFIPVT